MEIYYCSKCPGRPYTVKLSFGTVCPECGENLRFEEVSEESLAMRPKLNSISRKSINIDFKNIFSNTRENTELQESNVSYQVLDGESYYFYLGFKNFGHGSMSYRFILGNSSDVNGVVTKTPLVSSERFFERGIEVAETEQNRHSIEKYLISDGWEADPDKVLTLSRNESAMIKKSYFELSAYEDTGNSFENRYFIEYMQPKFSDIAINPFKKSEKGFLDKLKEVHDVQNELFMKNICLRTKNNGEVKPLISFADAGAVLYDDPYTYLARYDMIVRRLKLSKI